MALNDACCNTPATDAEWVNKGVDKVLPTQVNGEDRMTYRTGPKDSKRAIIGVYDIFGFHPTGYQFFDRLALANGGFQVSVPLMFKQKSVAPTLLGNRPALMEFIAEHGNYKNSHLDDLIRAAVEDLRADGCTSFSITGQCWGTFIAIQAAADESSVFLAAGRPHPSMITVESVKDVKCQVPVIESVKHKNFAVE
ncbi:hypothetical protein BGW39_011786 [Mortierella sp. 14UC]|nr:hypothetical protein BGW39_011786 [Mortierella sp. 14UC]